MQRQAATVALLGIGIVAMSTVGLMAVSKFDFGSVLFESASAFGTVGLSTGITAQLPPSGQVILIVEMFIGRVGPIAVAAALALRIRSRRYHYPKERPLIG